MPFTIFDSGEGTSTTRRRRNAVSIALGKVSNNVDLLSQGKVLVRIPALDREVWARLVAPGAANGRGLLINPQIDEEVLVAFHQADPNDAYLLGGLWSTSNRMPVSTFNDALSKRILKTGISDLPGHTLEFDDAFQSITITTSTGQEIKMSPAEIVIKTKLSKVRLGLDGSVDVTGVAAKMTMSTSGAVSITGTSISLQAPNIEIKGTNITVTGANVKIN